jgi:hypothetical protein
MGGRAPEAAVAQGRAPEAVAAGPHARGGGGAGSVRPRRRRWQRARVWWRQGRGARAQVREDRACGGVERDPIGLLLRYL